MITICIPVYNLNVNALVDELVRQAAALDVPVEIIAIDDCSLQAYRELNATLSLKTRFVQLDRNIGRAKIRNLFLQYAIYDHLLFLDCDSVIVRPAFLKTYLEAIPDTNEHVICGGRIYDPVKPRRHKMLRWRYGVLRESQPVEMRKRHPNKSFMTNNFLIHKQLLHLIKFEERLTEYGHEDTLFGYALKKRGVAITHIDNPVLNGDVEDNDVYLAKTEKSIENLVKITDFTSNDCAFANEVALLRAAKKLKRTGMVPVFALLFRILKTPLKKRLASGHVNISLFDFYKLGLFLEYEHKPL